MLSGEGKEDGEKTTIGLISKKATLHVQRTFLYISCRCFARLRRKTSRNFLVTAGYLFYGGNVVRTYSCSLFLFFTAAHFHLGGR